MKGNIALFRRLVTLEKNDFVVVRIIKRRKDNPAMDTTEQLLKNRYFYSWDELEWDMDRIIDLCDKQNARAYISLNKENAVEVTLRCVQQMIRNMQNDCPHKNMSAWDSQVAKGKSGIWRVLDVDEHVFTIPTRNGYHIITRRFDKRILTEINERFRFNNIEEIKINENALTLLYYGEN